MQKGIFLHTIFLNGRDDALRIFFLKQRTQLILGFTEKFVEDRVNNHLLEETKNNS